MSRDDKSSGPTGCAIFWAVFFAILAAGLILLKVAESNFIFKVRPG